MAGNDHSLAEQTAQLLAGLSIGSQNSGVLGELFIDGRPARLVVEQVLADGSAPLAHRRRCLRALQRLDDPHSISAYVALLADPEEELVAQVLHDFVHDQPSLVWIQPLTAAVRARVPRADLLVQALAALGAEDAIDDLLHYGERGEREGGIAIVALRRILRVDLGDELEAYRDHALAVSHTPQIDRLVADLDHLDQRVREAAVEDLAMRGHRACVPGILQLAEQGKGGRHAAAQLALRLLPHLPELAADARGFRGGKPSPVGLLGVLQSRFGNTKS